MTSVLPATTPRCPGRAATDPGAAECADCLRRTAPAMGQWQAQPMQPPSPWLGRCPARIAAGEGL